MSDLATLRIGDTVLVRGRVEKVPVLINEEGNVGIVFNHPTSGKTTHYVQADAIVTVEHRAFQAGDKVRGAGRNVVGTVLFVGEDRAFVRWPDETTHGMWGRKAETATLFSHLEHAA